MDLFEKEKGTLGRVPLFFPGLWGSALALADLLVQPNGERQGHGNAEDARDALIAQFRIMERRLWFAITWPSSILAVTFGVGMLYHIPGYLAQPWLHVKLGFVALLLVYQAVGHRIWATLRHEDAPWSSTAYRLLNEVPTVILIAAVF